MSIPSPERPAAPSPRRPALRRSGLVASAAVLLTAAAGLTWWGVVTPYGSNAEVDPITVPAPAKEISYVCPSGPGNSIEAVDVDTPAESSTLGVFGRGATATYQGSAIAGSTATTNADGGIAILTPASSEDPASLSGLILTSTAAGDLRGLAAAPCVTPSAMSWIVGGSGAVGSSANLRLTNPGITTVTARITLFSSTGILSMPSGGEVAVPAGKTTSVLLEAATAGDDRIAVSVEADGGSLVATLASEGLNGETPAGTEVLTAGSAPATSLLIPGVILDAASAASGNSAASAAGGAEASAAPSESASEAASEGASPESAEASASPTASVEPSAVASGSASPSLSSGEGADEASGAVSYEASDLATSPVVRIVNPHSEAAKVSVTLIGKDGEEPLAGAQNLEVDPDAVFDVSLAGVPEGAYGIRVTSDLSVAAAARMVRLGGEYPDASGTHVRDVAWIQAQDAEGTINGAVTLPAIGAENAPASTLVITNDGGSAVTVNLAAAVAGTDASVGGGDVTDAATSVPSSGPSVPVRVPAHGTVSVDLATAGLPAGTKTVTLSAPKGAKVASAVVFTQEVASSGTPSQSGLTGDTSGTLISVVPALPDATVSASRSLLLR